MELDLAMKKLLLALGFSLWSFAAFAQCTGVFPAQTLCGNLSGSPQPPAAFSASGTIVGPASSTLNGLPVWANAVGTQLKDAVISGVAITGNYTWGGTQTYSAANTFNAAANFTSTFQINGNAQTFPSVVATLAYLAGNQTYTGNNIWSGNNTYQTGVFNFTGTFQIGGTTVTLPVSSSNGGSGVSAPTAHTIPINEGASAQANTGAGVVGQHLGSNGPGVDPSFQSGGWVLLNTLTASNSATLADTTSLTAAYDEYEITFTNLIPATNAVLGELQVHSGGTFQATSYINSAFGTAGSTTISASNATTYIALNQTNTVNNSSPGISGYIRISNPASTTVAKSWIGQVGYLTSAIFVNAVLGGMWNSTAAIDGFQVLMSSGNITSGTVRVYGRL